MQVASVGRGHHFSGQYGQLVELILRQITPLTAIGVKGHQQPTSTRTTLSNQERKE
jgi:hypothetical protein